MLRESTEGSGYAICYENVMKYILALLPAREMMEDGRRSTVFAYPQIAIREAMANALIHRLCKALHNLCYAKLIVMQSYCRIHWFYRKSGSFYFA